MRLAPIGIALTVGLAGCGRAAPRAAAPPSIQGSCISTGCSGEVQEVPFAVERPRQWNGTLLIWSPGYRDPVTGTHVEQPGRSTDAPSPPVAAQLLAKGYALAGADAPGGWGVGEEVRAAELLHAWFNTHVAPPKRTLVWGESLGGLVTEVVAERHPDWADGAAPECATLGGSIRKFNLDLDAAYAVQRLLLPTVALRGFTGPAQAHADLTAARAALSRPDPRTQAQLAFIAALFGAPERSGRQDGRTPASRLAAWKEGVLAYLDSATIRRALLDARIGGDPSGNRGVDYANRIDAVQAAAIDAIFPGTVENALAALATGPRTAPDPPAVAAIQRMGEPTGAIHHPTVTLHTVADPQVPVQNERVFAEEVAAHHASANLLQLYTEPPAAYGDAGRAPYGAGHCVFTDAERIAQIDLLDAWVRSGQVPDRKAIAASVSGGAGFATDFTPAPWPTEFTPNAKAENMTRS
ncbi:MAG: DUF6351 family protein [Acidimicrobiales bacterium]